MQHVNGTDPDLDFKLNPLAEAVGCGSSQLWLERHG